METSILTKACVVIVGQTSLSEKPRVSSEQWDLIVSCSQPRQEQLDRKNPSVERRGTRRYQMEVCMFYVRRAHLYFIV